MLTISDTAARGWSDRGQVRSLRSRANPQITGWAIRAPMKNLDDVIEEIESRLDEKDEVRELTIKSSRTIARLSGSAIQGMHRGNDVDTQLQENREEILKLRSILTDTTDLSPNGTLE